MADRSTRVLFICLGNICRSPMAEAIFRHMVKARGLSEQITMQSAGTGDWHIGCPADARARAVLQNHGIEHTATARQLHRDDFQHFDLILCMDERNFDLVRRLAPDEPSRHKVHLIRELDPAGPGVVNDPYFGAAGDLSGFETTFTVLERCCRAWLDRIVSPS